MSALQSIPPQAIYDDEIDLFELWDKLWKQRIFIVAITVIAAMIALAYLLLIAKPVYQANAYLLPPLIQDVQELGVLNSNSNSNKVELVKSTYLSFQQNLQSRQLRRDFFDNKKLLKLYSNSDGEVDASSINKIFEEIFNKDLKVSIPKKGDSINIQFELEARMLAAELLNEFIELSLSKTVNELVDSINVDIETQKNILNDRMAAMRKIALIRRQDRVTQLEVSLSLAVASGITEARVYDSANKLNMDYMRGAKVIENEIRILKSRKSDDAFIPELRKLDERYSYLTSIKIDKEKIRPAIIDQPAHIPEDPIKPKKSLIMAISIVLGGMLGVILSLLRSAIQSRKEKAA